MTDFLLKVGDVTDVMLKVGDVTDVMLKVDDVMLKVGDVTNVMLKVGDVMLKVGDVILKVRDVILCRLMLTACVRCWVIPSPRTRWTGRSHRPSTDQSSSRPAGSSTGTILRLV